MIRPFSYLNILVLIVRVRGFMKYYTVFFVVFVFSCFIGGVLGASPGVPASLEITEVACSEGIISATILVENDSNNPIAQKYLGIYLLPPDFTGAEPSIFVGWVALPYLRVGESTTVPFTGAVPFGTVGGTYQITALVTTNYGLASPQFSKTPMQEVTVQGSSGSATEMTAFPVTNRVRVTPDAPNYQITEISVPSSLSLYPGARITPSVSVVNAGGDAVVEGTPVSVMLLLGNQVLYPEEATIPSIAAGKSAKVQLSYKVPDNIYLGAYTMRGLVNPYGTIPETNEGDNTFVIPGIYFISDNWVEAKIAAGGCGCGS